MRVGEKVLLGLFLGFIFTNAAVSLSAATSHTIGQDGQKNSGNNSLVKKKNSVSVQNG
jgi:hypothetical protein